MEIVAEKREALGKKTKNIRNKRKLPAVVYGKDFASTPLTINSLNFIKIYKEAGETTLIDLKINGSTEKVLVKEIQVHPVTLAPIHVSFHKVDLKEKIRANVPVEVVGEDDCEVVKSGKGLVLTLLNEIEVEALPTDLPQSFEVSVAALAEVGQGITVKELVFNRKKVEIIGVEEDELIVKIDYAEMEEEEEEELTEEELVEGIEATEEKAEDEEEAAEETPKEQPKQEVEEEKKE